MFAKAFKNNNTEGELVDLLCCTVNHLKNYLQSKFKEGMSWDNYGREVDSWQIDHVIPLCAFNLSDSMELKKAWHYTNLQPLWKKDNMNKGIKS